MVKKIYVLDTSVLINDPLCYETYKNSDVVIPIIVLEELDKIKKYADDAGRNARVAIRYLDALSKEGKIHEGIKLNSGGVLRIDALYNGVVGMDPSYGDNKILASASKIKARNKDKQIVLVSRDINLRVRAAALGLLTESYEKDAVQYSDLYAGHQTIVNQEAGEVLAASKILSLSDYELPALHENEFICFTNEKGKGIASGKKIKNQIKLMKDHSPWNLELRNKEQFFAADLLMDINIPMVSVIGMAGSGKSLVSVACGLELVLNKRLYERFVIYRPISTVGAELGFLPGTEQEKLAPYYGPIDDAFALLLADKSRKKDGWKAQLFQYMTNGTIKYEALTYIRGRSIPNALILIDESQNLNKDEMKTILTRVGPGSKIIINGDISQIDVKGLDIMNNGLTYIIEKFKNYDLAGHIMFKKGERSALSELAAQIL